jgi:hypothetical protein
MTTCFASFNAASDLNGARIEQQFFSKRSFTRIWVRDDGKAAASKYFCAWCAEGGGFDGNFAPFNLSLVAIISGCEASELLFRPYVAPLSLEVGSNECDPF